MVIKGLFIWPCQHTSFGDLTGIREEWLRYFHIHLHIIIGPVDMSVDSRARGSLVPRQVITPLCGSNILIFKTVIKTEPTSYRTNVRIS